MEKTKRKPLSEEDRAKLLLWCARHCCFCGKPCTTNMEIHHIDGDKSNSELDNLIPVCFDCHGELLRYNPKHPKGTPYRFVEIKKRRDQIYDQQTLPYMRQVEIQISNKLFGKNEVRTTGDISCTAILHSKDLPVRLSIRITPYLNGEKIQAELGDLYSGKQLWNLNPSQIVFGHFNLPISLEVVPFLYRVDISWSIVDILDREHVMLPFGFVWDWPERDWWYDPRVLKET